MKWGILNDPKREAYLCEETGWVVFASVIDGYWLVFLTGEEDKHYGPYEDETDAKMWAERLQGLAERLAEEDEGSFMH